MFSRMDPDNSGFVEEPEFEAYMRDQQLGMSEARIKQLYHTIKVAKLPFLPTFTFVNHTELHHYGGTS